MTAPTIHDHLRAARRQMLAELRARPTEAARVRHAQDICERTGGSFIAPDQVAPWGSHMAELTLLGVSHCGDSEAAAVAGWMRAAARIDRDTDADTTGHLERTPA